MVHIHVELCCQVIHWPEAMDQPVRAIIGGYGRWEIGRVVATDAKLAFLVQRGSTQYTGIVAAGAMNVPNGIDEVVKKSVYQGVNVEVVDGQVRVLRFFTCAPSQCCRFSSFGRPRSEELQAVT